MFPSEPMAVIPLVKTRISNHVDGFKQSRENLYMGFMYSIVGEALHVLDVYIPAIIN